MATSLQSLHAYLLALPLSERLEFAARCGTSLGYLYKAISRAKSRRGRLGRGGLRGHKFGAELAVAIERESGGKVRCETLRPDVDWRALRNTAAEVVAEEALAGVDALVDESTAEVVS